MIVVSGTITLDPAKNDTFVAATEPLLEATRAEEGCISYGFWHSPEQPGVWRAFEEWTSEDAMNQHMSTPHMAAFIMAMGECGVTGANLTRYDVENVSKFM